MNTQKFLSAFLLCSLTTTSIFSSTWYVFDEKSITGEAEQLLFNVFKPAEQANPTVAAKIKTLIHNEGKQALAQEVFTEHKNAPFKNQVEAKQYAANVKGSVALSLQDRYVENFLNEHINYTVPVNPYFNIEQLKRDIREKYANQALQHLKTKGNLATFLQNLDKNLESELATKLFSFACYTCDKYRQQHYK